MNTSASDTRTDLYKDRRIQVHPVQGQGPVSIKTDECKYIQYKDKDRSKCAKCNNSTVIII